VQIQRPPPWQRVSTAPCSGWRPKMSNGTAPSRDTHTSGPQKQTRFSGVVPDVSLLRPNTSQPRFLPGCRVTPDSSSRDEPHKAIASVTASKGAASISWSPRLAGYKQQDFRQLVSRQSEHVVFGSNPGFSMSGTTQICILGRSSLSEPTTARRVWKAVFSCRFHQV
jgi:hypothetical protein